MLKQPTTFEQQIEILRQRGCEIHDEDECKRVLEHVNYYRLSAYFLPYRTRNDDYKPNTDFDTVYRIYEFDRKLRTILFSAIEEIEIFFRSVIVYLHAHKYGALGYLDEANFNSNHNHTKFLEQINREIDNNRKILFVKHHLDNYNGEFPIWVISELFTFGMLSYFYSDMQAADQKQIARKLGVGHKNVASWLRCCTDLRNICAHYGRMYYRVFSAIPANLPDECKNHKRSLFSAMLALRGLSPDIRKWNNDIVLPFTALVEEYSEYIQLEHIGFPENWKTILNK